MRPLLMIPGFGGLLLLSSFGFTSAVAVAIDRRDLGSSNPLLERQEQNDNTTLAAPIVAEPSQHWYPLPSTSAVVVSSK